MNRLAICLLIITLHQVFCEKSIQVTSKKRRVELTKNPCSKNGLMSRMILKEEDVLRRISQGRFPIRKCRNQRSLCVRKGGICVARYYRVGVYYRYCDDYTDNNCRKRKGCGCCILCINNPPREKCKAVGGSCKRTCDEEETPMYDGCTSRRCICCVPPPPTTTSTTTTTTTTTPPTTTTTSTTTSTTSTTTTTPEPVCEEVISRDCFNEHGSCRSECYPHEVKREASCIYNSCKCCGLCRDSGTLCSFAGGVCLRNASMCDSGIVFPDGCIDRGCSCCITTSFTPSSMGPSSSVYEFPSSISSFPRSVSVIPCYSIKPSFDSADVDRQNTFSAPSSSSDINMDRIPFL